MNRQKLLGLFAPILMIIGLMLSLAGSASAAPQTLTILGASGRPGTTDPYTEFSRDNGATWHQAYLYSGHPWGQIPGTNAWINCAPSGHACEYETVLYRIRFVVPGGWSNPRMAFDVKADNHAWISVNGGPTTYVEGQNSFNVDATIASSLKTGMNEVAIKVKDDGGWIGLNYKITLSLDAPTPPSTLPAGQLPPPDTTPPTITATVTPPANANGWRNTDVQIAFACADTQSDVRNCPAPALISTEGASQSYTATASDAAGNTGSVTVSGINIDRTAPVTSISAPTGWQNKDVPVSFTATDNLSGVAATYYTVDGGAQQTGTTLSLTTDGVHTLTYWSVDTAGNAEGQQTATIQIDKTAPTITGAADRAATASGWYSADVTVTFTCADGLSGVADCTTGVTLAEGQGQSASGTVTDKAGNAASATVSGINIDRTAPVTSISAPTGWQNKDVPVSFTATDNLSGVAATYYTVDGGAQQTGTTLSLTTDGVHTLTYWSVDTAGNAEGQQTATIQIDKTAPTITGAADRAATASGWYSADVTVTFTCGDGLSGVADCTTGVTLAEGQGQSASGTVTDKAGNAASATVSGINIDKTAPVTTATSPQANSAGWSKADVTVTLAATDNLSGVATTEYNRDGAGWVAYTAGIPIQAEGVHTLQYRSVDKAGNAEPAQTLTVRIDKTAPEAYLQFDPLTRQLQLFGQDALSGVITTGPITPVSVTRPKSDDRNDRNNRNNREDDRNKGGEYGEVRTYLVKDSADNTLQLVVGVKTEGSQIKASVISLQYNGGKLIAPLLDSLSFEWSAGKESKSQQLEQQLTVIAGSSRRSVNAHFDAKKNVTVIQTGEPGANAEGNGNENDHDHKGGERSAQVTLPGMVLLRMTTSQGRLVIEVPGL